MVRKDIKVSVSDRCHPNGPQSAIGARLSGRTTLLNARAATTTVDISGQEFVLERVLFFRMLKHTVYAENTKLSGRRAGHSHQPSIGLGLFCLKRLQQVTPKLLQNVVERIRDFFDLKNW